MRILFLIRSLNRGGAERQLITLSKELHYLGHSVSVAVFYAEGDLDKELEASGVTIHNLMKKGRWDVIPFFIRLISLTREVRPEIIYSFMGIPNIISIFLKPFFHKTRMVWGVRSSDMRLEKYDKFSIISYKLEIFLSRFAEKIICNSRAGLLHSAASGFSANKLSVVENGIDTHYFIPSLDERLSFRKTWNVAEDEVLIGVVARLDVMKDHKTFLRAASIALKANTHLKFICVGAGTESYKLDLLKVCLDLGISDKVIWAGPQVEMRKVFNMLDVLVSSSSFGEGFSNSIAEAMSCGIPCVVTDVGDSCLIVGKEGICIPKEDPESLANGILTMVERLTNERSQLKSAARQRIVDNFSVEKLIEKTIYELGCAT